MKGSPSYDLRPVVREQVAYLFELFHGYKGLSASMTYGFGVYEVGVPVAGYAWQPPPPGAAKAVCPEAPQGVLSLSRMVAVPKGLRRLKHISKPLRRQMGSLIDRTRWPVLVTYSDEGEGHNGFVYECSGWAKTDRNLRPVYEDADGVRCSSYSNGKHGGRDLERVGDTWIQRWENRVCANGEAAAWMAAHGWVRVPTGRKYRNGRDAFTYERRAA